MGNEQTTESQKSPALDKILTMADLEEYVKSKEEGGALIIIIHDKVYDLTKFKNEHPGGAEVLEQLHLKDGSEGFDDIGHSPDALEMMDDYVLGSFQR